ncbi:MAG TPA: tRNA (N6-threonylcarbamoyladenosine(37)-N6)-methyltransferase TrmO, partial [Gammaproteobacteria bacterium]
LQEFSHVWITFAFHANLQQGWKKKVKPPRLGGRKQVGVFASRSPHRPNFLGLSVLKLEAIHTSKPVSLSVSGIDLLDDTPVFDIKPYVAYSDSIGSARSGFAQAAPETVQNVTFSDEVLTLLSTRLNGEEDRQLIHDVLAQDPRPAYKTTRVTERNFGMLLGDYEIKWKIEGQTTQVVELKIVE